MKTLLKFALASAIASALAGWSVYAVVHRRSPAIHRGPWMASLAAGSAHGGLYERAWIATHRLWALDASEVIYYLAKTDSTGRRLSNTASYRIEGTDLDTRWWSLAAYKDGRLISNELNRYAVTQTTVEREPDGRWVILLSPIPHETNWLPSGEQLGDLMLVLRCYNPSPLLTADPAAASLPTIVREVDE